MKIAETELKKTVFARLLEDEDLLAAIASTADENGVNAGFFFLIGTLKKAILGFFRKGEYLPIKKMGPLEIVSCIGNISVKKDELVVHGHLAVSDGKGHVFGGHLLRGCKVDATAELVIVQAEDGILKRELDPVRNLHLWTVKKKNTQLV